MNYGDGNQPMVRCRRVLALCFFTSLILTASGCSRNKDVNGSRQVADRFVDLYYARMNMAEAVKLCSGAARTKLEAQMNAVKGVQPDNPAGEPRVTIELTASEKLSANDVVYSYRITAQTSDVAPILATLTTAAQEGRWTIRSFSEKQSPRG